MKRQSSEQKAPGSWGQSARLSHFSESVTKPLYNSEAKGDGDTALALLSGPQVVWFLYQTTCLRTLPFFPSHWLQECFVVSLELSLVLLIGCNWLLPSTRNAAGRAGGGGAALLRCKMFFLTLLMFFCERYQRLQRGLIHPLWEEAGVFCTSLLPYTTN